MYITQIYFNSFVLHATSKLYVTTCIEPIGQCMYVPPSFGENGRSTFSMYVRKGDNRAFLLKCHKYKGQKKGLGTGKNEDT